MERLAARVVDDTSDSLEFSGEIWQWRGPAPYYFVTVPAEQCHILKATASLVSYGWGMIPVKVRIGKTAWQTSLFPKAGGYVVPLKDSVRKAEALEEGDEVTVQLEVHARGAVERTRATKAP